MFDKRIIENFYSAMPDKISKVRRFFNHPMTVAQKILSIHLHKNMVMRQFASGKDYVDFSPDRVAMQDATAQMALLQFIMAGKDKTAIPTTVHCDHLIQAKEKADIDLKVAKKVIMRFTNS